MEYDYDKQIDVILNPKPVTSPAKLTKSALKSKQSPQSASVVRPNPDFGQTAVGEGRGSKIF
jgi:hypothetical protein